MTQKSKKNTILFRFLKWIVSILLVLCIAIYFLNQGIKSKYYGFHRLDKDSIESVVIYKFVANAINHYHDSLILSKNQINKFVIKWNNSYPVGPYKYIPEFTLTVKMINGNSRYFRIAGATIKERIDFGFQFICGDDLFESIWNKK